MLFWKAREGASITCDQLQTAAAGETRTAVLDLTGLLASADLLTGTPTVTVTLADGTATVGVTLASKVVNTGAIVDGNGDTIAIGKAVQWSTACVTAGFYLITVTPASTASPTQTIKRNCRLNVV